MNDKTFMRKVNREGILTFMKKDYVIESRGFERRMVDVFYNSSTGEVDYVRDEELGESKVHPVKFEDVRWKCYE